MPLVAADTTPDVSLAKPLNDVASVVVPVTSNAPAKVTLLSWSTVTAVTCVIVLLGVTLIKVLAPLAIAPQLCVATPSNDACG